MTRRFRFAWVVAVVLAASCSRATPEQQIVNDAATAMGGADAIRAAATMVIEGEGTQYNPGQDVTPSATGQTFTLTNYRRAVDLSAGRARTEFIRQPNFTFFQGPQPQPQVQGIDRAVGYNVAANGDAARIPDAAAADRRAELYHHPLVAVRAALDPMATHANPRVEGSESLVDVTAADGTAFTLAIDTVGKLPTRVVTRAYNTNLGDVVMSTTFEDYMASGGLQLPARLTTRMDDLTVQEIRAASATVGGDAGNLAAPEAAASAPAVSGPPPVKVAEERIAPGVWYLTGGSHHSVLIEFSDHLMLVEAPQNATRALAVIARAREIVPGKPLTQLVNSHHHFDHSGGVRAAIAEGLTVITHEGNAAFFEEIARRPHTIVPDALAITPRDLTIETVGSDGREYGDSTMTVNLYPITGAHSETMLMAYLPRQRLLIEVDVYNPGNPVQMFAGGFLETVKNRNLRIDRIVPLHANIGTYAQFVKEATAAGTN